MEIWIPFLINDAQIFSPFSLFRNQRQSIDGNTVYSYYDNMISYTYKEDLRLTTSHETNGKADLRTRSGIASEVLFYSSH